MSDALATFLNAELERPQPPDIAAAARIIGERLGASAMLFYGSVLRTGDLGGVLDFYALLPGPAPTRAGRWLWPDVGFHEVVMGEHTLRAKVAAMPLATFAAAAQGRGIDTTIWTRFVQPTALVHTADAATRARVVAAVRAAAITAARFAAVLGPNQGPADAFWRALFRQTYRAELRVEPPGREAQVLAHDPARYARLLPLAWSAGGVGFDGGAVLAPRLEPVQRRRWRRIWARRRRLGKPLNAARLVKAAFTFDGAARYGLWKVERHTGIAVPLTPWRERHPVLAAPGVLLRVWAQRR